MMFARETTNMRRETTNMRESSIVVTWLGIIAVMAIVLGGLAYSSPGDDLRHNVVVHGVIPPFRG